MYKGVYSVTAEFQCKGAKKQRREEHNDFDHGFHGFHGRGEGRKMEAERDLKQGSHKGRELERET